MSTDATPKPPYTQFDFLLADEMQVQMTVTMKAAKEIFDYFRENKLFRWHDANNDCEDRANAACLLLDEWKVANAKAWVFSGTFRKKEEGNLTNCWNYHVAAALPVQAEDSLQYFVIDPATSPALIPVDQCALQITESGTSYHFIKRGEVYIFPTGKITKDNWYARNRRNYNWTMQRLSGINGASIKGRAQLAFQKQRAKKTEAIFKLQRNMRPAFLT